MAHELSFTNGKADMVYRAAGGTPWHNEGTPIETLEQALGRPLTFDEQLESANMLYEVVKRPTFIQCTTDDGDTYHKQSEHAFTTWRTDTEQELGMVGTGYKVLQNGDAFRVLQPMVDAGVLTLETAGVLRGGADAWVLGKFDIEKFGPTVREVFGDEVIPYALITNNHNGRRNATVAETPIRVVCANTLGMAEHDMDNGRARSVGVRHSENAETKIVEAAEELFVSVVERYEAVAAQYKLLKSTILSRQMFERLVLDTVAPDPRKHPRFNPEARMADAVLERAERKRSEVTRLWMSGKGHTGEPNAWYAYNGLVEAVDHNIELFPTRSGVYRTASMLEGSLRLIKGNVLNKLVKYAQRVGDMGADDAALSLEA
jgi:phage/plasmid-like protein (TIGR03299 family)